MDLLLSMKFLPGTLVCGMPDRIVRHIKSKAPHLLREHLGMLLEPTDENVRLAKSGKLKVGLCHKEGHADPPPFPLSEMTPSKSDCKWCANVLNRTRK